MPRTSRSNQHHTVSHTPSQPQPSHQTSTMYSQQRSDPQVQRSQGVIFLSTNKPQVPATPPAPLPPQAHMAHQQVNQMPAHNTSMFQNQHVPAFVPPTLMQNPFFPYYHPFPTSTTTMLPSNDVYTPNGMGTGSTYDNSMQVPPSPVKPKKTKRRSRYTADDSDSSSDAEFMDDEEDPDWAPTTGEEVQEPVFETQSRRGGTRGRRASTTPRGRGRGRGSRGGGRGRGRGRVSDFSNNRSDAPPTLVAQNAQMQSQISTTGRQTRNSLNMPSLDPQSGQLSFGELVSAAVQSLNEPDDGYTSNHHQKKQRRLMAAVILTQPNKVILIERVPLAAPATMFVPVNLTASVSSNDKEENSLVDEEEDLIMAYEIVQEEDKKRPFMCETCGKETRSRVLHNQHLVTHNPSHRFACCICSQLFEDHAKLKPHLRTHHGSGIFVCPEVDCEGVFSERKSLDDHDFACHPNARPFVCRFCLDRFPTTVDATAHEDAHDEEITASCMKCNEIYNTKTELRNHYSHMHEEKTCKYCEKKFENQPALDEHQNEVHQEEMKPPPEPTPEPSPEPPTLDDDPMPSPVGNDAADDDDDIVVVEEHKKSTTTPLTAKKPDVRKPKIIETKSTPKPGPSPKSKPGPKPKPKPIIRNKPTTTSTSNDIITLSSDDEKDPEWSPGPEFKLTKRSSPMTPVRRTSRRKAEYVVIVESRTEETAKDVLKKTAKNSNQPLTFVMGDSGDLVHVPTSSDPHPPNSLPLKEIMEMIKSKNLKDNTTIVIEDNKISSVKPSGPPKPGPLSRTSVGISKAPPGPASKKPRTTLEPLEKNKINKPSSSTNLKPVEQLAKPVSLVAKKRTGGIPRTEKRDIVKKLPELEPIVIEKEKSKLKPVAGPIAKKRTGGSNAIYDSMKQKEDSNGSYARREKQPRRDDSNDSYVRREKQPRKDTHRVRDDLDEPVIIEDDEPTSAKHFSSTKASSSFSSSHKKDKKGKYKTPISSSKHRESEQQVQQSFDSVVDYDNAPKRSLRIALKASVADETNEGSPASGVELDDPIGDDDYEPTDPLAPSTPPSQKRRGRPSAKTQSSSNSSSFTKNLGEDSATAASNGQVVMRALVNGKWQDVVIGTKLGSEQSSPMQTTSLNAPIAVPIDTPERAVNARKSTGGNKRLIPAPSARGGRGGKRGGGKKRGRKPAKQTTNCWRDDRYQYFSDGSGMVSNFSETVNEYSVDESVPVKDDPSYHYAENQEYGADDDTVLPFSLSSYMTYHQDDSQPVEPEEEPDDQGLPVILNAYHVSETPDELNSYHDTYANDVGGLYKNDANNAHDVDESEEIDEIPLRDPLADDGPMEEPADYDPLGCSEPGPVKHEPELPEPPKAPAEPKKGTVQEAKSAVSNLRSILSQITFKR